ncbi:unnamed protein product, partial [Urochloa humidicola]
SSLTEGEVKCICREWLVLGDSNRLFSSGDFTIGAFELEAFSSGDFLRFPVETFLFTNNDFILATLLKAEASSSVCILFCPPAS